MRMDNIELLRETLQIMDKGFYHRENRNFFGKRVKLKLSSKQMETAYVFLPDEIKNMSGRTKDSHGDSVSEKCEYSCEKIDSFVLAAKRYREYDHIFRNGEKEKILVLNMANPVHPGGGVRRGARAQEEDLCRKSSLLLSLESESAWKYYAYNRLLDTYMGSDAIILSPEVEIIRDENNRLLEESYIVSVLTCAAPMAKYGIDGMSEAEYQDIVYHRMAGMLRCAAYWNYRYLILGAWGCGAFGNDPHVISDLFNRALREVDYFKQVDFAVLDRSERQDNFKEFCRNFASGNN